MRIGFSTQGPAWGEAPCPRSDDPLGVPATLVAGTVVGAVEVVLAISFAALTVPKNTQPCTRRVRRCALWVPA